MNQEVADAAGELSPLRFDKFDWNLDESDNAVRVDFEPLSYSRTIDEDADSLEKPLEPRPKKSRIYFQEEDNTTKTKRPPRLRRRKKPNGMPKRPLSAYNIFFQKERTRLMQDGSSALPSGKIGFEQLGKIIGQRWRNLDESEMAVYKGLADEDSQRYRGEMGAYEDAKFNFDQKSKKSKRNDVGESVNEFQNKSTNQVGCAGYATPMHRNSMQHMPTVPHCSENQGTASRSPPQRFRHCSVRNPCRASNCTRCGSMRQQQQEQKQPRDNKGFHLQRRQMSGGSFPPRVQGAPFFAGFNPSSQQSNPPSFQQDFSRQNPIPFPPNSFPIPPGYQISIPDAVGSMKNYRVEYAMVSMTVNEAKSYMEQMSNQTQDMPQGVGTALPLSNNGSWQQGRHSP